ncbi:hypothetical protein OIDMADRAFT_181258 [Oidiodendron maius Zn]|uniref:NmrA-like domain-containing protein n=1 Tax=Oidiodendron maius (strain Zn) TaxID=913774 RepID=A0A0C3H9R7_OIDMZ|nr:hypothetical protein OIDMADRAFT_181258 [Oidiodendron maius Zn]
MSFKPRNLLLFGATGQIGAFILDALLSARDEFERIAIFTSQNTVETKADSLVRLKKNGVEIIVGEISDEEAVGKAYEGIDTVISAVGRGAILAQIPLIRLASAAPSVKWFLPSEYGTDIAYSPASAYEKPHQGKLKIRAYLENKIEVPHLAYTYVVTGPYADMYVYLLGEGPRAVGGWDAKEKKSTLVGEKGEGRVSLTTMKDVGTLVLATLRHPAESWNRALKVNSFTTTPAAIQAEFERQTGGERWTDVTYTSLPELRTLENQAWESGAPTAPLITLRRIWAEGGTLYEKRDNAMIGEPPVQTLEEVVAQELQRVNS